MRPTGRSQARVDAAALWYERLGGVDAPVWEDVEIAVRLGVADPSLLRRLLLRDVDSLVARWTDVQAAVGAGEPVAGPAAGRLAALTAWFDSATSTGRDLAGLTLADLTRLAQAAPTQVREFKRFGPALRAHDRELLDVLNVIPEAASDAPAKPKDTAEVTPPAPSAPRRRAGKTGSAGASRPSNPPAHASGPTNTTGFAAFDYATQLPADQRRNPAKITFAAIGDDSLQMTWPLPVDDGPVRIYRIAAHNGYDPAPSPQLGEMICATFDGHATDAREFTSPVRHFAVWVNEGTTEQGARDAQPTCYAKGGCVLPVRRCVIREDEGTVIGQWEASEGVLRIDVLRVPIDLAEQNAHYNHAWRLEAASVGPGGFNDSAAGPGAEYEYRIYAVASISGQAEELSPYVARRVKVAAVLKAVDDLSVSQSEGSETTYDLRWTMPPLGKVEIYRSEKPPAPGIRQEVLSRASLERAELTADLRMTRPLDSVGVEGGMRNVPWPRGWSRAYFTPVTVLGEDQIRVGTTEMLIRAGAVTHVRLIERVDEQFLTFAWPEGLGMVKIFVGATGAELVNAEAQRAEAELSQEDYARFGGAHLPNPLPGEGCTVHVVGTTYSQGRAVLAKPVAIDYPGLARITYDIVLSGQTGRFGRSASPARRVLVRCDRSVENVPLVLVHNPRRLPLYAGDGQELARRQLSFAPDANQVFDESLDLTGKTGFVRLFVDVPPQKEHLLAVLDPAVDHLRCG